MKNKILGFISALVYYPIALFAYIWIVGKMSVFTIRYAITHPNYTDDEIDKAMYDYWMSIRANIEGVP